MALGAPIARLEARAKVRGRADYAGDLRPAGLVHARIVGAPHARGVVTRITVPGEAGLLAVYRPGDFAELVLPAMAAIGARPQPGAAAQSWLPMRDAAVNHHGQAVAIVVAQSAKEARDAAAAARVEMEREEVLIALDRALAGPPFEGEVGTQPAEQVRGDPWGAFATAAHAVEATWEQAPQLHMAMERHTTLAEWSGGRLVVHESSQWVLGLRMALAEALGVGEEMVEVRSEHFGGGFGNKCFAWPHTILAAAVARRIGRPVRLELEREQVASLAGHRTPASHRVRIAADAKGRLTAIEHDAVCRGTRQVGDDSLLPAYGGVMRMLYAAPAVRTVQSVMRADVPQATIMRAPAQGSAMVALEGAMDELAEARGMDPLAFRILNHADTDPEHDRPWSSKNLLECYRLGAERFGWDGWSAAPRSNTAGRRLRGRGMASATYYGIRQPSQASVTLHADGRAVGRAATHDLGTGARTVFAQVVADRLGLPVERCGFELGRSDLPPSGLTGISMTTATVASAIAAACDALLEAIDSLRPPGDGRGPPAEVLLARGLPELTARGETGAQDQTEDRSLYVFGAVFAEVEVDEARGPVTPVRVVGVYDYGRVLNAATAEAQLRGGIIQGLGMALSEELHEDPATGRPLNPGFDGYRVPTQTALPTIEVVSLDRPDPFAGALGAKGCGEVGFVGVAPAILAAVHHATGRRVRRVPLRPQELGVAP